MRRKLSFCPSAKNQPHAIRSPLNLSGGLDKSFDRPAFGVAIFGPWIQGEQQATGLVHLIEAKSLDYRGDFIIGNHQSRRDWFRVCPHDGSQLQVLMEVMSGRR